MEHPYEACYPSPPVAIKIVNGGGEKPADFHASSTLTLLGRSGSKHSAISDTTAVGVSAKYSLVSEVTCAPDTKHRGTISSCNKYSETSDNASGRTTKHSEINSTTSIREAKYNNISNITSVSTCAITNSASVTNDSAGVADVNRMEEPKACLENDPCDNSKQNSDVKQEKNPNSLVRGASSSRTTIASAGDSGTTECSSGVSYTILSSSSGSSFDSSCTTISSSGVSYTILNSSGGSRTALKNAKHSLKTRAYDTVDRKQDYGVLHHHTTEDDCATEFKKSRNLKKSVSPSIEKMPSIQCEPSTAADESHIKIELENNDNTKNYHNLDKNQMVFEKKSLSPLSVSFATSDDCNNYLLLPHVSLATTPTTPTTHLSSAPNNFSIDGSSSAITGDDDANNLRYTTYFCYPWAYGKMLSELWLLYFFTIKSIIIEFHSLIQHLYIIDEILERYIIAK